MKKIILICILTLILPLSSCKNYDTEINLLAPLSSFADGTCDYMDVIKEFENKYNIKVNVTTYQSSENQVEKIKSENTDFDLVITSDLATRRLIANNMLEQIDFEQIPNYKYVSDEFKNNYFDVDNKYTVVYDYRYLGVVYNKKVVQEPQKSFKILWNESYKDSILMTDNVAGAFSIAFKKMEFSSDKIKKEDIDKATEILIEQKTLVKEYTSSDLEQKLEQGIAVTPCYSGDGINMLIKNSSNVGFFYPTEGTLKTINSMSVLKAAKNKKLALTLINYFCEPNVAIQNIKFTKNSTPNTAVFEMLPDKTKECKIAYPLEEYKEKCFILSNLALDEENYMYQKFSEIK